MSPVGISGKGNVGKGDFGKPPMAPKKISKIWETARVKGDAEPVGCVTNGFFDAARSPSHINLISKFNSM